MHRPVCAPVLSHCSGSRPGPVSASSGCEAELARAWPSGTCLALAPLASAVPCARLHARAVLAEWSLAGLRDTAELLVSELVTNAVSASQALPGRPPVELHLRTDGAEVLIMVGDASPRPPVPQDAAGEAEAGRGLLLVREMSRTWGWSPAPPGKAVWCTIRAEPQPPPAGPGRVAP